MLDIILCKVTPQKEAKELNVCHAQRAWKKTDSDRPSGRVV